MIKVKRRALA